MLLLPIGEFIRPDLIFQGLVASLRVSIFQATNNVLSTKNKILLITFTTSPSLSKLLNHFHNFSLITTTDTNLLFRLRMDHAVEVLVRTAAAQGYIVSKDYGASVFESNSEKLVEALNYLKNDIESRK
jgi:hypothetical protein